MIYVKDWFCNSTCSYSNIFEYIFIFSKGKPKTFNPICDKKNNWIYNKKQITQRRFDGNMDTKRVSTNEYTKRGNIWYYSSGYMKTTKDLEAYEHPAIMNEQLCIDLTKSWSNEKDLILDPFLGSGTTAIACLKLNRYYIGFEIEKEYYDLSERRIEKYNLQRRLF